MARVKQKSGSLVLPKIGAHLSIGKGLKNTADMAVQWELDTFQIFLRNPRGSRARSWNKEEIEVFTSTITDNQIGPVVAHIPYIVNPASCREDLYELAARIITEDLERCDMLGAEFLVLHPGSYGDDGKEAAIERLSNLLNKVLDGYTGPATILIEAMAGMGKEIGASVEELRAILQGTRHSLRIGICLDSCHLTGAGYDMTSSEGVKATLDEFDKTVGLDYVKLLHANDSQREIGSRIDRHASIGEGSIGIKGFQAMMNNTFLRNLPFILETPPENLQQDLQTLRTIRDEGY
ncbi:MAG: deoxyribonuclease IV [Chitinophagales bacterium]